MYNANLFLHLDYIVDGALAQQKTLDIGMANYEKRVEQEAAYPIPISLYNCYRTVRHEKRYQEYTAMPLFSCLTVL